MTAVLTAADTPPPPPDDGLPPGQPYVSPDDLSSIPPLFEAAAQQALLPLVAQIWSEAAGTVHAQLVDATDLPNLPPVSSLAAETYLAQAANTFAQVGDDLWNTARSELLAGFQAGESIPQLWERLRNSAGLTARKATLVARTQVLDASNAGSYATAQTAGIEGLRKGWLDTPDQRTRPTHRAAGATYGTDTGMIAMADQFTVGGYSCDRPHDPTLPASERYSCRCSLIYSMGPAAVRKAQEEAVPAPPLPNTSGQPIPTPEPTPAPTEIPLEGRAAQDSAPVRWDYQRRGLSAGLDDWTAADRAQADRVLTNWVYDKASYDRTKAGLDVDIGGAAEPKINAALRGNIPMSDALRADVDILDRAFVDSPLPQPAIVYRGFSESRGLLPDGWQDRPDLTGVTWNNKGFTSVTVDREGAEAYSGFAEQGGFAIRIRLPAQSRAVSIQDEIGGLDDEGEMILPRGLSFRVVADSGVDQSGIRWLDVDVTAPQVPPGALRRPVIVSRPTTSPVEAAAAQAAKIGQEVGSPPITRQLAAQAKLAPRAMADLDSVHIPSLDTPDGDAYLAAKNGAAHAYYTPLGSHPSVYATAEAATENPLPAIWFNPHWNGNRLGIAHRKGVESGWFSPTKVNPLESTLAHEYGHHVNRVLFEAPNFDGTADMRGAIAERVLGPINDALGANRASAFARNGDLLEAVHWGTAAEPRFSVPGQLLDEWVRQNHDLIAAKVSQYGAKNFDEFLAEVWQEYSTMGAAARPHIQTIGVLLRDVTEELRAGGGVLRAAEVIQLAEAPLSSRTVIQLRALAKERGIPGYSKLTKPQLVERLSAAPAEAPTAVAEAPLRGSAVYRALPIRDSDSLDKAFGDDFKISDAVGDYSDQGYQYVNYALRTTGGDPSKFPEAVPAIRGMIPSHYSRQRALDQVEGIDKAMESSRTTAPIMVHRAMVDPPPGWPKRNPAGFEWTDHAFVSTSAEERGIAKFGFVRMEIRVPTGTRAIGIDNAQPGLRSEREVLLQRGLRFRVIGSRTEGGRTIYEVEAAYPGTAKAARSVEVPLAKRRIGELRTLAKERGLTVPPRATKADLVRALEAPPKTAAEQAAEANAAKRAAAREKNRIIEGRAAAEQTLAELDDLLFKKADRQAFEQRIALAQLDPADLAALRQALGDPVKLRAQVTRISKKQGITVDGKAGAKVKFDPAVHDPVGEVPAPGTPMVVIRRGSTITVDGEEILLNKAVVKLPTAPVKATKAAKKAAPRKAAKTPAAVQQVPVYEPPTTVSAADRARALSLIRKDPQIYASARERFGRVSGSGNLSEPDMAWLQELWVRERAFVERLAQTVTIERDLARAARAAGMTPARFKAQVAAKLKEAFAGKPIGIRVSSEATLRQILADGRFKTQFEGAKRASGLKATVDTRRLAEEMQGVAADLPVTSRPVYGYVMPDGIRAAGIGSESGTDLLSTYGRIQVVLKPQVRIRTTASIGDSLDRIYGTQPSPIDAPTALSANPGYSWSIDEIDRIFADDFRQSNYVEAQIHGGVSSGDIDEVVFPQAPDEATAAALRDAGISWRVLAG